MMRNSALSDGYWIAADEAYDSLPGLQTPRFKSALNQDDGTYADSFNFYNSSHRIHVEQAFGVFVRK